MKAKFFLPILLLANSLVATEIFYSPKDARFDQEVFISITDLKPDTHYRVELAAGNIKGEWRSFAFFSSTSTGKIELKTSPALSGSYTGVDPMGLFWSLRWYSNPNFAEMDYSLLKNLKLTVNDGEGQEVATETISRVNCWGDPNIQREVSDKDGIFATYYYPKRASKNATVLVFSGSEGGKREETACSLASHGFTAVAVAYFKYPGLPHQLVEIPLEYFEGALAKIRQHERVDANKLAVMGGSRGGELSLLLGSRLPQFRAVVAYVPSGIVWSGIDDKGSESVPSWTKNGEPLPFARFDGTGLSFTKPPFSLKGGFENTLKNPEAIKNAIIPVENIRGAILLVSGTSDEVWPSTKFSEMVVERLKASKFQNEYHHLRYEGAGHMITSAYLPATVSSFGVMLMGGEPKANAFASSDSWPKVISFLKRHLQ
jgi:dienelactone hydrolase